MVLKYIISLIFIIPVYCFGQGNFMFNQHISEVPQDTLIWMISSNNLCDTDPWDVTQYGYFDTGVQYGIQYNISNSTNCGGTCSSIQSGESVATIYTSTSKQLSLTFEGIGEKESSAYEKIEFYLNDELVAEGHAPGGGLGCEMGAIIPVFYDTFPITLQANTITSFKIVFSTVDALYHFDAYYFIFLEVY